MKNKNSDSVGYFLEKTKNGVTKTVFVAVGPEEVGKGVTPFIRTCFVPPNVAAYKNTFNSLLNIKG